MFTKRQVEDLLDWVLIDTTYERSWDRGQGEIQFFWMDKDHNTTFTSELIDRYAKAKEVTPELSVYQYLHQLGWGDRGRTGAQEDYHEFRWLSSRNHIYRLQFDLSYGGAEFNIMIDVSWTGKSEWELLFRGNVADHRDIDFLMRALQID